MTFKVGDRVKIIKGGSGYPESGIVKIIGIHQEYHGDYYDFVVVDGAQKGSIYEGAAEKRFKKIGDIQVTIK